MNNKNGVLLLLLLLTNVFFVYALKLNIIAIIIITYIIISL